MHGNGGKRKANKRTRKKGSGTKTIAQGRKSHRCKKMEAAVQAKLDDPNLTVPQALRKVGFVFNVPDSELTAKSMVIEKTSSKTCKTLWGNFRSMKTRMMKDYGQ